MRHVLVLIILLFFFVSCQDRRGPKPAARNDLAYVHLNRNTGRWNIIFRGQAVDTFVIFLEDQINGQETYTAFWPSSGGVSIQNKSAIVTGQSVHSVFLSTLLNNIDSLKNEIGFKNECMETVDHYRATQFHVKTGADYFVSETWRNDPDKKGETNYDTCSLRSRLTSLADREKN
jgi:hypothetical protein